MIRKGICSLQNNYVKLFREFDRWTEDRVRHILYHLQEHMDYLPGILSGDGGDINDQVVVTQSEVFSR